MGFSRQEFWKRLPFLSPRDLPDPGIEPASLMSPALTGMFFTTEVKGSHSVMSDGSLVLNKSDLLFLIINITQVTE